MSSVPAIDNLIQASLEKLKWISFSEITDINSSQIDTIHYAMRKNYVHGKIILVFLGNSEECTPTLVSELARIYSLSTHKHNDNVSQFRRYEKWLKARNILIYGFTKPD